MSLGPGKVQRAIMAALDDVEFLSVAEAGLVAYGPAQQTNTTGDVSLTPSNRAGVRRALESLEREGIAFAAFTSSRDGVMWARREVALRYVTRLHGAFGRDALRDVPTPLLEAWASEGR